MKIYIPLLFSFSLWCFAPRAFAQPLEEKGDPLFYEKTAPILKRITPVAPGQSIDDSILALARQSKVNFIADATRFDTDVRLPAFPSHPQGAEWTPAFVNILTDLKYSAQLSDLRFERNTFLLWDRPDLKRTAQLVVQSGKSQPVDVKPDEETLCEELRVFVPFLALGRDGLRALPARKQEQQYRVAPLESFPVATQNHLVALARYGVLRPDWNVPQLLGDNFWKRARLSIEGNNDNAPIAISADEDTQPVRFYLNGFVLDAHETSPLHGAVSPRAENGVKAAVEETALLAPVLQTRVQGLSWKELDADAALSSPVSLEVKRETLPQLLKRLSTPERTLSVGERVPAAALRVTIGVEEMPLATLMSALSRTFGLTWVRTATGYAASDDGGDELAKVLLRNHGDLYRGEEDENSGEAISALQEDTLAALQFQPAPDGVPFSTLPVELQTRVRARVERLASAFLVRGYEGAYVFLSPRSEFVLSYAEGYGQNQTDPIRVTYQAASIFRAQTSAELGFPRPRAAGEVATNTDQELEPDTATVEEQPR